MNSINFVRLASIVINPSFTKFMASKGEVQKFLDTYKFKGPNTSSEIEDLPGILHDGEELVALLEGRLIKIHNKAVNGLGLLIATTRRVIFYRRSFIGTITREEFQREKISAISFRQGLMTSAVSITTSNNEALMDYCQTDPAKKFSDILQKLINEPVRAENQIQKAEDHLSKIERIFEMKERGILTEEEYLHEKRKLLGM